MSCQRASSDLLAIRTNRPSRSFRPMLPGSAASIALPRHRLPADVAAAETLGPVDAVDRPVGALSRFGNSCSGRADVQHAPAIGENFPAVSLGAGMKYLDAFDLGGIIETFDHRALAVIAGITPGSH